MNWNKNLFISSGIFAALGSTICCWGPALLGGIAGITGTASFFSWLHPLKPYLAGVAAISLSTAFYQVYRKPPKKSGACSYCVSRNKKKNNKTKAILWSVTVFAILSFSYPYFEYAARPNNTIRLSKSEKKIKLMITGMDCMSCSGRIHNALNQENGILVSKVIFDKGVATLKYDSLEISEREIIEKIRKLGFQARKVVDDQYEK